MRNVEIQKPKDIFCSFDQRGIDLYVSRSGKVWIGIDDGSMIKDDTEAFSLSRYFLSEDECNKFLQEAEKYISFMINNWCDYLDEEFIDWDFMIALRGLRKLAKIFYEDHKTIKWKDLPKEINDFYRKEIEYID